MAGCVSYRYESDNGERFWELVLNRETLVTRHGRVGTDGRASAPKRFAAPDDMWREAHKRIATTVAKGYRLVRDRAPEEELDPDAAAAVLAEPLSEAAWDELPLAGPRGELAMKHGPARGEPSWESPTAEELSLFKRYPELVPPRVLTLWKKKPRHSSVADLSLAANSAPEVPPGVTRLAWRRGYLWAAHLGRESARPPSTLRELVMELLPHPSARFLHRLVIGAMGPPDEYDYREVVEAITSCTSESLRELVLARFTADQCALGWSRLGPLGGLPKALPRLSSLSLRGGEMDLTDLSLPNLQSLTVTGVNPAGLEHLARAHWPNLTHLHLNPVELPLPSATLRALLQRTPALEELKLAQTVQTAELLEAVLAHTAQHPLRVLDLTGGDLSDASIPEGGDLGVGCIDVQGNYLSGEALRALSDRGLRVLDGAQRHHHRGQSVVTLARLQEFAPDSRSIAAAQKILGDEHWPRRGRHGDLLWGQCQGGELYDVFVNASNLDAGCTCPSPKYPCKHAIALLTMAARDIELADVAPPEGWIERTYAS